MTKKLKYTLITLLLALVTCLGIATVYAKYTTTKPIGDGNFNLSITSSKKIYAVYGEAFDNDNNSLGEALNFYNRSMSEVGDTITYDNGKQTVETIYTNIGTTGSTGAAAREWYNVAGNVKSVTVVDTGIPLTTMYNMFRNFTSAVSIDINKFDTSNLTNMSVAFRNSSILEVLDLSNFDTSKVTDMRQAFYTCNNLTTIYVANKWSTGGETAGGAGMFTSATKLVGGNGTTMSDTGKTYACIDGIGGQPGYLTGIVHPKIDATLEGTIWNFSAVSGKTNFAPDTQSYIKLSGTVPSEVMITSSDESVQSQILTVDSDGVVTIPAEFMKKYHSFTISEAVGGNVYAIFDSSNGSLNFYDSAIIPTPSATQTIYTGFDTGSYGYSGNAPWYSNRKAITNVTFVNEIAPLSTKYWFYQFENLETINNLDRLNTLNVTDMYGMFMYCSSLMSLDLSGFNTVNVTDMGEMFSGCSSITSLDLSYFNTEKVKSFYYMFDGCSQLAELDLSSFDSSEVVDMTGMFRYCSSITSLDLSHFNTSKAELMLEMFCGCSSLIELNLSSFDTSKVEFMDSMFSGCSSLTSLDLSNFNTQNVYMMYDMFGNCEKLVTIYASENFIIDNLWEHPEPMFEGCTALKGGDVTTYDENNVNSDYAHIDGLNGQPGYFTCKHTFVDGVCSICGKNNVITVTNKEELDIAIDKAQDYVVVNATIEKSSIKANKGVTVTVENVTLVNVTAATSLISAEGGTIIVEYAKDTSNPGRGGVLNASGGVIIIKDGEYAAQSLAMGDSKGEITIEGGKFTVNYFNGYYGMMMQVGKLTIKGGYFNIDPSAYVSEASGYTVIEITEGEFYDDGYRYQVVPIS